MATYIALLRAVNVGGTASLAMSDLKALCETLGFADARTFIQSGNVVFRSGSSKARVKAELEEALAAKMRKSVHVFLRTGKEMAEVHERNPFAPEPGSKVLVYFFDAPVSDKNVAAIPIPGSERIKAAGREVYVHYPDGSGRSKLKLTRLGTTTSRNINSVAKLAAMASVRGRS